MKVTKEEFRILSDYIFRVSGITISDDKHYLIEQRLDPLMRVSGMSSFQDLIRRLSKSDDCCAIRDKVIEAITTNETSFFRDIHPFETFKEYVLPRLGALIKERKAKSGQRKGPKISIWCAASSTGQEPYSLAMLVYEYALANSFNGISRDDFGILASDISTQVLAQAMAGEYSDLEVARGLSIEKREKYFVKRGNMWTIKPIIQSMVEFRKVNITESFHGLGGFDMIFCRNILIYFNDETKRKIFKQFRQMLADTGYLMLGACENIHLLSTEYESIHNKKTIIYKCKH